MRQVYAPAGGVVREMGFSGNVAVREDSRGSVSFGFTHHGQREEDCAAAWEGGG